MTPGVGTLLVGHIEHAVERRAIIDASPELRERDRSKTAEVCKALYASLQQRGTDDGTARLVAQIATIAFENAFLRWMDARGGDEFASCLHTVTASLRDAVAAGPGPSGSPGSSPRPS